MHTENVHSSHRSDFSHSNIHETDLGTDLKFAGMIEEC